MINIVIINNATIDVTHSDSTLRVMSIPFEMSNRYRKQQHAYRAIETLNHYCVFTLSFPLLRVDVVFIQLKPYEISQ